MPDPENNRSGGPKTPDGKARSSQNARKHGCCSNRLILPDESEQEFHDLRQGWLDDYNPGTQTGLSLVAKAAEAEWFLLRALRRHEEAEQGLAAEEPDMLQWTEEQHKRLERMLRYRTTAERAFGRALANLERLRKSRGQEAERLIRQQERETALAMRAKREEARAELERQPVKRKQPKVEEPKTRAEQLFNGKEAKKNQRPVHTLEQWVEIDVAEGKTVTRLFPSNEELIEDGKKMDPPPDMVYRRFHFVGSVPPEYHWATGDAQRREAGGIGIQRMTPDEWLELIEEEKARGDGHIGPCGGNLPRPKERGGCDCPVCAANRELLEEEAGDREEAIEEVDKG